MGRLFYYILNSFCCLLYHREHRRYRNCCSIRQAQEDLLFSTLWDNQNSSYGKKYEFSNIHSLEQYRKQVPLTTYEDYLPYIEQIAEGAKQVLTTEDVILLEQTSGSASASKLIPYTKTLKKQFQKGIKPWIYNLYESYPALKWGQSYWSVTPVTGKKSYTKGGIPIGFEEDSEYFGKLEQYCMNLVFAAPKDIAVESDMDQFYFKTVQSLLKAQHLTLISIWNPTFLLLLLNYLDDNQERLIRSLPKKRQGQIRQAISERQYKKVWKSLQVISCWTDCNASIDAKKLTQLFPDVVIQPKGLLATEGFISFPFAGETGAGISFYSHFFEFYSSKDKQFYAIDELNTGERYEVILTTGGGFYRYRIKDTIAVCGHRGQVPLIRFTGRCDKVSDLYGEKLNEQFVASALEKWEQESTFCMLAPEQDRYILYIQSQDLPNSEQLDEILCQNFHYEYCRRLGQLKNPLIFQLTGNPRQEYMQQCQSQGQRMGDIKHSILSLKQGWSAVFIGQLLET